MSYLTKEIINLIPNHCITMGTKITIEIDDLRKVKQHALDTNKSLKQLINEAIKEKIQYERGQLHKGNLKHSIDDLRPKCSALLCSRSRV